MFTKTQTTKSGLEEVIDELLASMRTVSEDSDEYSKMADQLVKIYALKAQDKPERVSPDTLAIIAGNLVGITLIVGYERAHVVTSKAVSFVLKAR